jgi:hypothetical protein
MSNAAPDKAANSISAHALGMPARKGKPVAGKKYKPSIEVTKNFGLTNADAFKTVMVAIIVGRGRKVNASVYTVVTSVRKWKC